MQHAAKLIKLCICIIKTAKHFQAVANHHFSLVPEFVPGFIKDREESNRVKKSSGSEQIELLQCYKKGWIENTYTCKIFRVSHRQS